MVMKLQAPIRGTVPGRRASPRISACHNSDCKGQSRRTVLGAGVVTLSSVLAASSPQAARAFMLPGFEDLARSGKMQLTDDDWKARLSPEAYLVLRKAATEMPGTSPLNKEKRKGTFVCAGCGSPLFESATKYNSGTGWPSFYAAIPGAVDELPDNSIPFMPRTEVRCNTCQGHLGHVFDDGPRPTGLRYCMNGLALAFVPENAAVPAV